MNKSEFRRCLLLLLPVLLLVTSATSCGAVDVDDVLNKAGGLVDDAGKMVKDAVGETAEDASDEPAGGGRTVSRPPRPTGTVSTGPSLIVASQVVGTSGGGVKVQKPGDPLDGLEIQIPAGAYSSDRQFNISSAPISGHDFGEYFQPLSPLITIENGGEYSNGLMTVRIPVEIPPDYFAMAFYYDEETGSLEGIPFVSADETSVTVATRHFSNLTVSGIENAVLDALLEAGIDSGFRPGADDWQFTNYGSYIAPGGHCAGQSLTALWYYCERPDGVDPFLWGLYDKNGKEPATPDLWADDSYGYRFASTVHEDINWSSFENDFMFELRGASDELAFKAFAYGMQLTGEPQEVGIYSSAGGGHDMICYRVDRGNLYIADPNYPGNTERRIEYSNGSFKPYNSGANAAEIEAGNGKAYETIQYCAKTATIDWARIAARWNEFKAGTIGNDRFPAYQIVVVDDENNAEPLVDGYVSELKKIRIRVDANVPLGTKVYRNGVKVDRDANGKYELADGNNIIGVEIWGDVNNDPQNRQWQYIDFQYINVQYGEEECYGWVLESVTTEKYYEMPSDAYFQNLKFEASETGAFSGSGDFFAYDPDPSGSADDVFAHHTTSGSWTPPPSCIPPDEPVYLDMRCTSNVVFDQNVDWGTLDTYLLISDGTYSTDYGRINHVLDNVTTSADDSIVAAVYLYEGFEGIGPMEIKVRCGTPAGSVEFVYTYVWQE